MLIGLRGGALFTGYVCLSFMLVACEPTVEFNPNQIDADTGRWYSESMRNQGQLVFSQNCASCHGDNAEGLAEDWRQRLADGSLPPPPLNGTAHAWHHPLPVLLQVIDEGGVAFGGKMPPFARLLTDEQKRSAVAYFQSFWSDEIYQQWLQMGGVQ